LRARFVIPEGTPSSCGNPETGFHLFVAHHQALGSPEMRQIFKNPEI
jgi:hypothetical protein